MRDLLVIARSDLRQIYEGGASRDGAIVEFLSDKSNVKFFDKNRFSHLYYFTKLLLFSRKKTILLFYPFVGWPYYGRSLFRIILREIGISLIRLGSKRHNIIVDVSDLPEEQSADLGLENCGNICRFERSLFKNAKKLFIASPGFKQAIVKKHGVTEEKIIVCLNGGPSLRAYPTRSSKTTKKLELIKCVYAGTLTRGRSIEQMIAQFSKTNNATLDLIGSHGSWLETSTLPKNVTYHGSLEESQALLFCAGCDLGLIPYDETKKYYNICYPTKTGFYLSAGVPFLSTPCEQVQKVSSLYNVGYLSSISHWYSVLNGITMENVVEEKNKIHVIKNHFNWETILQQTYGKFFFDE